MPPEDRRDLTPDNPFDRLLLTRGQSVLTRSPNGFLAVLATVHVPSGPGLRDTLEAGLRGRRN